MRRTEPENPVTFVARAWPDVHQSWLQERAKLRVSLRGKEGYADYRNRPDSFATRVIGEHVALSWIGDYTDPSSKRRCSEYLTQIASAKGTVLVFLKAPAEQFDALRLPFVRMADSIRVAKW